MNRAELNPWGQGRGLDSLRAVCAGPGKPLMRLLRHDMQEARLVPPDGTTSLEFKPHPYACSRASFEKHGHLIEPEEYFAYGLRVQTYSVYPEINADVILMEKEARAVRDLLLEPANLDFVIGCLPKLFIPVSRILNTRMKTEQWRNPDLAFPETGRRHDGSEYDTHTHMGIRLDDLESCFDLCIHKDCKVLPMHIPAQQTYKITVYWPEAIPYAEDLLGKVYLRISLIGMFLQCFS